MNVVAPGARHVLTQEANDLALRVRTRSKELRISDAVVWSNVAVAEDPAGIFERVLARIELRTRKLLDLAEAMARTPNARVSAAKPFGLELVFDGVLDSVQHVPRAARARVARTSR
jgi:hypothetical protein